ncbi:tetratricopeptide repeat protein [Cellulophaga sp. BC115SP]|uniref:tetratricopeptide repeat protein n=1 Tax=Cellulophaga sp. BC115SP TaxID=2683263 RepID=UPI001411EED3|nr:tetratricopeptide repeat protein [Cellulophaga sp. BC115SP]NBB30030.1 hypothetical protein [Cellulophaga sp. BC115SP]
MLWILLAWGSINIQAQTLRKSSVNKRKARTSIAKNQPKKSSHKKLSQPKLKSKFRTVAHSTLPIGIAKDGLLRADSLFKSGQHNMAFPLYLDYKDTPMMKASSLKNLAICFKETGDFLNAQKYFKRAYLYDSDPDSATELGKLYLSGVSEIPKNALLAKDYFEMAYRVGNLEAGFQLGRLYWFGANQIEANFPKALDILTDVGQKGHTEAQWMLANLYTKGTPNTPKNLPEAKKWYRLYNQSISLKNTLISNN